MVEMSLVTDSKQVERRSVRVVAARMDDASGAVYLTHDGCRFCS